MKVFKQHQTCVGQKTDHVKGNQSKCKVCGGVWDSLYIWVFVLYKYRILPISFQELMVACVSGRGCGVENEF